GVIQDLQLAIKKTLLNFTIPFFGMQKIKKNMLPILMMFGLSIQKKRKRETNMVQEEVNILVEALKELHTKTVKYPKIIGISQWLLGMQMKMLITQHKSPKLYFKE